MFVGEGPLVQEVLRWFTKVRQHRHRLTAGLHSSYYLRVLETGVIKKSEVIVKVKIFPSYLFHKGSYRDLL